MPDEFECLFQYESNNFLIFLNNTISCTVKHGFYQKKSAHYIRANTVCFRDHGIRQHYCVYIIVSLPVFLKSKVGVGQLTVEFGTPWP